MRFPSGFSLIDLSPSKKKAWSNRQIFRAGPWLPSVVPATNGCLTSEERNRHKPMDFIQRQKHPASSSLFHSQSRRVKSQEGGDLHRCQTYVFGGSVPPHFASITGYLSLSVFFCCWFLVSPPIIITSVLLETASLDLEPRHSPSSEQALHVFLFYLGGGSGAASTETAHWL